jgi:hypothetical protein
MRLQPSRKNPSLKKNASFQLAGVILVLSIFCFGLYYWNQEHVKRDVLGAKRPTCVVCHSDKFVIPIYQVNDGACGQDVETPDLSCSPEATEVVRYVHGGPGQREKSPVGWFCKSCQNILSLKYKPPLLDFLEK